MNNLNLENILSHEKIALLRKTVEHFLKDPDYATGEEKGLTFQTLSFGHPLPLEIVLRDWNTELDYGNGDREIKKGDCYQIYVKLYESGLMEEVNFEDIL